MLKNYKKVLSVQQTDCLSGEPYVLGNIIQLNGEQFSFHEIVESQQPYVTLLKKEFLPSLRYALKGKISTVITIGAEVIPCLKSIRVIMQKLVHEVDVLPYKNKGLCARFVQAIGNNLIDLLTGKKANGQLRAHHFSTMNEFDKLLRCPRRDSNHTLLSVRWGYQLMIPPYKWVYGKINFLLMKPKKDKSLMTLYKILSFLEKGNSKLPYGESNFTTLLDGQIGAKTTVISCFSQDDKLPYIKEVLEFGKCAKKDFKIPMKRPKKTPVKNFILEFHSPPDNDIIGCNALSYVSPKPNTHEERMKGYQTSRIDRGEKYCHYNSIMKKPQLTLQCVPRMHYQQLKFRSKRSASCSNLVDQREKFEESRRCFTPTASGIGTAFPKFPGRGNQRVLFPPSPFSSIKNPLAGVLSGDNLKM